MSKTAAISLVLIAVIISIAAPTLVAIHMAKRAGLEAETNRAMAYARDVLHRSDGIIEQISGGIKKLVTLHSGDPCSDASIALMREIDLGSSYIQAIGHTSGELLVCSSLGKHNPGLLLGPVRMTTPTGYSVRDNVKFPFAGNETFIVVGIKDYAAIIHKHLPIDTSTDESDVALAAYFQQYGQIVTSRGFIKPEWVTALGNRKEVTFLDSGYVVAVVNSTKHVSASAIAAVPVLYLDRKISSLTILLVPIGLISGIILSLAVLYLAKLQLAMPAVLKTALRRNEFFLNYQPIVDLNTGKWIGAESLIRWRRPNGEMVRPDLFIPVAEDTGLIQRITKRVIELTARDTVQFFNRFPDFKIGINLSPLDLHSRRTIDLLKDFIRDTHVQPNTLVIEVTERGFLDPDIAREMVRELRANKIRVSIDDFGTGYSSLHYLETFELDILKIDKAFVGTIGTEAATSQVILHIIEMAKTLKLEMIAEGVESEVQAQFLRECGVKYAQGWLFGKPMTASDLVNNLEHQEKQAILEEQPAN